LLHAGLIRRKHPVSRSERIQIKATTIVAYPTGTPTSNPTYPRAIQLLDQAHSLQKILPVFQNILRGGGGAKIGHHRLPYISLTAIRKD
jgi:hypothetical protein